MSVLSERLAKVMLEALLDEHARMEREHADKATVSDGIDAICEVVAAGIAAIPDAGGRELAFERVVYAAETGAAGVVEVQ